MKRYGKKLVSVALVMVMLLTMLPASASGLNESDIQDQVISDELLKVMGVTYKELLSGDYEDSGDTYSCIIWIEDIDMEQAVRAGIDAAEMTRATYSMNQEYEYPYEVMDVNGQKVVEVNLAADENNTYVQTYINAERATAAEMYATKNSAFVADTFRARTATVKYVSSYSPCVFADLTVSKVAELLAEDEVQRIGYWSEEGSSDAAGTGNCFTDAEFSDLTTHLEIIRVDEARSVYGMTGSGVRVGQIESGCTVEDTVIRQSGYTTTTHANTVYTIMHAVAPDATYYGAAGGTGSNFKGGIEWLISQGVNLINCSYGLTPSGNNAYNETSRWLDHIAYNHDVHFVVASGNNGRNKVLFQGMAYNVITVGNTNMTGDYSINSSSSYNGLSVDRTAQRTFKPDICAPGTYSSGNHGTSYSAPLVTGTIALMCQLEPALKTKQHVVKAILAATTSKTIRKYVTTDSNFAIYGAGMLDARSALWAVYKGNFSASTGTVSSSSTTKDYNMTVTSSDTLMRVALAYANRMKFESSTGHADLDGLTGTIGELRLDVYSPSGSLVASCTTTGANLKIVEFDPRPYGTGTYTIRVTQTVSASGSRATNFGIAWR